LYISGKEKSKVFMKKCFLSVFSFIVIFTACNSETDKTLFKSAGEMYKVKNYAGAASEYEKLLTQFANSSYSEDCYFALAGIYQMEKIPNLKKEDAMNKAVNYLQKYYSKFPNKERTPKVLFMIGYIRANELKDYDSARLSYNEFLSRYPQHELASSVKLELENLGKTPEQILQKNNAVK
jgi:outer membrane protein assembly factor BamD (BamD/ComL family)